MQTSVVTTIVPRFPGYVQTKEGFVVGWAPVPRIYSPPVLHAGVRMAMLEIGHLSPAVIALVIGGHGFYFKNITERSGALYLFVRGSVVEVWGYGFSVEKALYFLNGRIEAVLHYRPTDYIIEPSTQNTQTTGNTTIQNTQPNGNTGITGMTVMV